MTQSPWSTLREIFARMSVGFFAYQARRVDPDRSGQELFARQASVGLPLRAGVYLYRNKIFLISAISSIAEVGPVAILPYETPAGDLGKCICDHLLRYKARMPSGSRFKKLRDWKVFRASRARSLKQFNAQTRQILVEMKGPELKFHAWPMTVPISECITDTLSTVSRHEEIGHMVHKLMEACTVLDRSNAQ